jgi:hypothetical protein
MICRAKADHEGRKADWCGMREEYADATATRRASGELEAAVLAVLQEAQGALSPAEVREKVGGDLAYTTVVTILSRLHAKGVLQHVLDSEPDREAVLARFVSALSDRDEDMLRRMLGETADQPGHGP